MLMRTVPVMLLVLTLTGCGLKTTLDTSTEQKTTAAGSTQAKTAGSTQAKTAGSTKAKTAGSTQATTAGSTQANTASSTQAKQAASPNPVSCLNVTGLRGVVTIKAGAEWQGFHTQNGKEDYAVYIDRHPTEDAATQYIARSPDLFTGHVGAWTVTGPRSAGSGMNGSQLSTARHLVERLVACIRR
jgi:predicted small lipoprotein YifL